jgi:hypothetical protein
MFAILIYRCKQKHITKARDSVAVEALCYKSEGRGLEIRLGEYLILPAALGPRVYSASNRNEYQNHANIVSGE